MLGPELVPVGHTQIEWEGRRYTFFGGNDYHRFSRNPLVVGAMQEAATTYGINSAGSRATTANHPLYRALETKLASFLGTEDAATLSAGYLSNAVLLQAVERDHSHVFLDEIAHASLVEAVAQTSLPVVRFRHRDAEHLGEIVRDRLHPGDRPVVATDGVFPSSGELPPLGAYLDVLADWDSKLLLDDAHALATVGDTGKGSWEELGVPRDVVYQTGTLSKGLGGFGGLVTGSSAHIAQVREGSPAFTGSTPAPLPIAAATLKAVEILEADPGKVHLLRERSLRVKQAFREMGFKCSAGPAPICSVTFLDADKNRNLYGILKQAEIYPVFINYPGCPPGGHFRFTLSSAHTDEDIAHLLTTVSSSVA